MFLLETTNLKVANTGLQNKLRSGSFVIFTVRKKIDADLYRILLAGRSMSVRSSEVLIEGSRMRAQVSWIKNRLQLKVSSEERDPLANLLNRSNIIIKNESRMIAEGLIRACMPLHPEYFEKIQVVLKKYKKSDDRLIRILLLLIDKGIPLTEKNITEILHLGERHEEKHSKSGKKDEKSRKNITTEEIKASIKKQIKHTARKHQRRTERKLEKLTIGIKETTKDTNKGIKYWLRRALMKYQLHKDQDLFERAYAYIKEYY